MSNQTSNDAILTSIITNGDLSKLSADQKVSYYRNFCERLGLDPLSQPFKLLRLNGKEILYCDRSGTQQLNKLHSVSHEIRAREIVNGCYVVTSQASTPDGRHTESIGAVPIENLRGDNLCNAMMKAETKAKRRATLDLLGLGILDETETETIPAIEAKMPAPVAGGNKPPSPPAAPKAAAPEDNGEENAKKKIEERLNAIKDADCIEDAIKEHDKAPDWMKGNKQYMNAVNEHMEYQCPEQWSEYQQAVKAAAKTKPRAIATETSDPMKTKYSSPEALEEALGKAFTVSQLADLYYVNIETIEKNAVLKALFTARKLQITNGSLQEEVLHG